jgi:hypothetical protein
MYALVFSMASSWSTPKRGERGTRFGFDQQDGIDQLECVWRGWAAESLSHVLAVEFVAFLYEAASTLAPGTVAAARTSGTVGSRRAAPERGSGLALRTGDAPSAPFELAVDAVTEVVPHPAQSPAGSAYMRHARDNLSRWTWLDNAWSDMRSGWSDSEYAPNVFAWRLGIRVD